MMKKAFFLGSLILLLLLAACGGNQESSGGDATGDSGGSEGSEEGSYALNIGIVVTENDPIYEGLVEFKNNVEARTNGDLTVEIYPNSQLGDTAEIQEQAMAGANVGTVADAGIMADFNHEMGILQGPYLLEDYEEIKTVTTSDLFQGWADDLAAEHNLKILSMNWYQGARHMVTNKPIHEPADLNGLSIRTIGADVFLKSIEAMGANPTGLAWAEVYSGIQQGVIDGAEAQHPATHGASLYEVADYLSKTAHFQLVTGLVIGDTWFNSLPEEYQTIVLEEAVAGGEFASQRVMDQLDEYEAMMAEAGMEIIEVDTAPFREATDTVYEQFEGYAELREQINELLGH
ncbi:C4-dicarboxylate TRAP transporter substrate-binding protein [Halalkalibacter oceani]|uniref:C4-dicarboxylate TRAP transporter substrate-binding protein n=1 Tax=Halalkalibacter oceani TaxID=1653776 RepID=A0A9X2IPL9_9BACI|nr:C4-dicarboxylate TRAP transporter substrate-binding protein [Halalkalibacter oceani]MCM3715385.1 C4-dicarboxylate TRAP transporter substrate-binding protein [Halalkalibacter oceani]